MTIDKQSHTTRNGAIARSPPIQPGVILLELTNLNRRCKKATTGNMGPMLQGVDEPSGTHKAELLLKWWSARKLSIAGKGEDRLFPS